MPSPPLPERGEHEGVVVRRWTVDDAPVLDALIADNLEHLRPFMPWIAEEPVGLDKRRELLVGWDAGWRGGGDVVMAVVLDGRPVGSAGLHRRIGPTGVEIGYWIDAGHTGRGLARRATHALTDLAFAVPGIDHVEIHHDAENEASRRIPERLGYRWVGEVHLTRDLAPGETGVDWIWRVTRDEWGAGPGA
jgi:RimJ/RimL family protein N-acetyltransferase